MEVEGPFAEVGDAAGEIAACFVAGVDDRFDDKVRESIADENFKVLERECINSSSYEMTAWERRESLLAGSRQTYRRLPMIRLNRLAQSAQ